MDCAQHSARTMGLQSQGLLHHFQYDHVRIFGNDISVYTFKLNECKYYFSLHTLIFNRNVFSQVDEHGKPALRAAEYDLRAQPPPSADGWTTDMPFYAI